MGGAEPWAKRWPGSAYSVSLRKCWQSIRQSEPSKRCPPPPRPPISLRETGPCSVTNAVGLRSRVGFGPALALSLADIAVRALLAGAVVELRSPSLVSRHCLERALSGARAGIADSAIRPARSGSLFWPERAIVSARFFNCAMAACSPRGIAVPVAQRLALHRLAALASRRRAHVA